jgi:hypothetical protein
MSDDTPGQVPGTPNAGQAPAPGSGQEPPASTPPGTAGQNPNLVDVTAMDDRGQLLWFPRAYVDELRQEAASNRSRYRDVQRELEASRGQPDQPPPAPAPATPPPPTPTPPAPPNPLEAETQRLRIENAVLAAAARETDQRARFIDPADAVRLADLSKVTLGDDGTISGVDEALDALAKAKPHLLVPARRSGAGLGATNPAGSGTGEPAVVQRIRARYKGDASAAFAGGGVFNPNAEE